MATVDELMERLYGDPDAPGFTGSVPRIEAALHSQNKATIAIHEKLAMLPCSTESMRLKTVEKLGEDHEHRIRSIERWRWKVVGIASGLTILGGATAAFVDNLLAYFKVLGG